MAPSNEIKQANVRAARTLKATARATAVRYDRRLDRVVVSLNSGLDVMFAPASAQGLEHARPTDLREIEITPTGLGLHFPKLDADIYLPGLLTGLLGSKKWAAARLGAVGGAVRSPAKAKSSRQNGRLGGRPKKHAVA